MVTNTPWHTIDRGRLSPGPSSRTDPKTSAARRLTGPGICLRNSRRIAPGAPARSGRLALVLASALLSGCAHLVKVSYPPEAVIRPAPAFNQRFTRWEGERVGLALA